MKKSKHRSLKETGTSYKQKLVRTDNHGQNIWNKLQAILDRNRQLCQPVLRKI